MTKHPSRNINATSSNPTDGLGPYVWNSATICFCSLERSFCIVVFSSAILGMEEYCAKSKKSISTAPSRLATSLYCFFSDMYTSMSTACTSMWSFMSADMVVVRCFLAWSRDLISRQISCTIRSDFSALSLIALILLKRASIDCLASPTACFVCTRSQLCCRTEREIPSDTDFRSLFTPASFMFNRLWSLRFFPALSASCFAKVSERSSGKISLM
mmetsp:Transcript_4588/g.6981  ORF Transcript_4588/g.6981 Transcript_4588/m.6981 type:complete len:215 (-) Transcript_4588:250-894(-)